jgi:tetratricopeptide (TPR) repeat protein
MMAVALAAWMAAGAAEVGEKAHREALEHYHEGESFLYAEDWTQAEREFRAAIALDPLLVLAHYSLGQTYMSAKEYPSAVRAFTGARDAFLQLAALGAKDAVKADQQREDEIRELRDGIRRVQNQYTQMTARNQQPDNAILRLESRIKDLETFKQKSLAGVVEVPAEFSLALGSAYFRTGALADAQREYEAALKVRPKFGEAHNNLAVVYMLEGKVQDADAHLKQAEKAGFHVNPLLKADLAKRLAGN